MVTLKELQDQFRRLNYKPTFWAREEIRELPHIIVPGEQITNIVIGWYEGGLALLMSTNYRVLLVDKKPFFLTVEDLRFNKIADVKYQYRLLDANICLNYTTGKSLEFKSWNKDGLRKLVNYVQEEIMLQRLTVADSTPSLPQQLEPAPQPVSYAQPILDQQQPELPVDPATQLAATAYQTSKQILRGDKLSRFVTMSQVNR